MPNIERGLWIGGGAFTWPGNRSEFPLTTNAVHVGLCNCSQSIWYTCATPTIRDHTASYALKGGSICFTLTEQVDLMIRYSSDLLHSDNIKHVNILSKTFSTRLCSSSTLLHRAVVALVAVPQTRLCATGDRAFPVAEAKIRNSNSLPSEVTSSKTS